MGERESEEDWEEGERGRARQGEGERKRASKRERGRAREWQTGGRTTEAEKAAAAVTS